MFVEQNKVLSSTLDSCDSETFKSLYKPNIQFII